MNKKKIVIIGGGAAGFFAAANLPFNKNYETIILEATQDLMRKIIISGGGRCNVTHACFEPKTLVNSYPRGHVALLSPFFTFNPSHTIEWFRQKNVTIVEEADHRMFPSTNSSETISNTLLNAALENKVQIFKGEKVNEIHVLENNNYEIFTTNKKFQADFLIIATGSNFPFQKVLQALQINVIPPVASLFTFNIKDKQLTDMMGISFADVSIKVKNSKLASSGPLLITHWGLSGPAILKLSAWGAREFSLLNYSFAININFTQKPVELIKEELTNFKTQNTKKTIASNPLYNIPKRYWSYLMTQLSIDEKMQWANISKSLFQQLMIQLTDAEFTIHGKSTYKDEFVTAGGVDLNEINFKTFEHKKYPNMYIIGEALDIDGITGGFNFQNCWTGAFIATQDILLKM